MTRLSCVILAAVIAGLAAPIAAQSAIEHHAWQDRALFEPFSRTAMAITGAIVLWGNPDFAEPGSTMRMTFEAGPSVDLVSVGASWRESGIWVAAASRPPRCSGSRRIRASC